MRFVTSLVPSLVAGCALAACASSETADLGFEPGSAEDPRRGEEVRQICFTRQLNGFDALTRDSVVLERGANDRFLVTVVGGCDVRDSFASLGVRSRGTSCLTRFDDLVIDRPVSGFGRCQIDRIYEWNPDALDAADEDGEADEDASDA